MLNANERQSVWYVVIAGLSYRHFQEGSESLSHVAAAHRYYQHLLCQYWLSLNTLLEARAENLQTLSNYNSIH